MKSARITDVAPLAFDRVAPFAGVRRYLSTGGLVRESLEFDEVTFTDRPSRADIQVQPSDVLFARMNATDKVLLITSELSDVLCSTGFAVLRPRPDLIDPRFLTFCLRSKAFQLAKNRLCTGATQKAITNDAISQIRIPLPPPAEQRSIASILGKADAIRRKRQSSIELADDLLRSVFLDTFGSPVTNTKRWPLKTIGEVALVTTGNTPSRLRPAYYGDEIEWIKSDNINTPEHIVTRAAEGLSAAGIHTGRIAEPGSTLMTCIAGSPSCIGNVALTDRRVALNQQINAITPKGFLDSAFLYVELLLLKPLIQGASTDSMKGMVSKGRLCGLKVPLPPLDLQKRFGGWFTRFIDWRDRLVVAKYETDELAASLSRMAFEPIRGATFER